MIYILHSENFIDKCKILHQNILKAVTKTCEKDLLKFS